MPLNADDKAFIKQHLARVSRTFAPGIAWLRAGLREGVGVAYLLCRILDTIEDSAHLDLNRRVALLEAAALLQIEAGDGAVWALAVADLVGDEASDDAALARETSETLGIYARLPSNQRAAIAGSFRTMARGMAEFTRRAASSDGLRIASYEDLRDYCYYVAGTVGEMLSGLFIAERAFDSTTAERLRSLDIAFGIGLQIVNIIKGVSADYRRRARFVPEDALSDARTTMDAMLADDSGQGARLVAAGLAGEALEHLRKAVTFTLTIPAGNDDIQAFCAFPCIMALRTCVLALQAEHVFPDDNALRVARPEVEALLADLPAIAATRASLEAFLDNEVSRLADALNKLMPTP